jgi:dTDP-glucose 4,6-dehydratase
MSKSTKKILITGGAGFIGANLVHQLLVAEPEASLVIVDVLTYAGNLKYIEDAVRDARVTFVQADIADMAAMSAVFTEHAPTQVYHLAAESHVDRSISGPGAFVMTNIVGTFTLLECARQLWSGGQAGRFLHVSTDEVFGSLGASGAFTEETPYDPSSPYSASKAGSDHLVRAYGRTYGMDVVITNCSNNFGPYQYPEKLIPVIIRNIRDSKALPVYGDGQNVRDWLYVEDHCSALHAVMERGESGRSYNVGTRNEWTNLALVERLCDLMDAELGREPGTSRGLITFVTDRPGHDRRYAIDPSRMEQELGWRPAHSFEQAIAHTVSWYVKNLGPMWAA